ncbi:DsbA family oxidoreductase [Dokdonella immobilis]|uniref:Predicted dithiol-disulfide isomerase, DsbA family n=1 Tax=Dokdonella immobilis TaxID=578942 RepID=A0A1I4WHS6_9GAMM|nr:DsbA family oxidoreductase [Dokdonella immobilis]SFN12987.1 Predicted dithiol-disulfide isomerase, DsbA family [Dokdonella immobilis]
MAISNAPTALKIDFVSDVSCPWCAIGLKSLEQAIARVGDSVEVELHFQPFELNPQMPAQGQDVAEHLRQKYGSTPEQLAANREAIRARGAALGFTFNQRDRIYNTFDAHRLLHWAALEGRDRELALKHALLRAYFTDGVDVSAQANLVRIAVEAGLDGDRAQAILESGEYGDEVRKQEQRYLDSGIHAVPAVIINDRHLISGGQPPEIFEDALRRIAAQG